MPIPKRIANVILFALTLLYLIMLGGGNYEHINVTPVITQAPPLSSAMLQGPYGFSPIRFWVTFRPLTILLFVAALAVHWKQSRQRRNLLLMAFLLDVLVTLATFLYFAPETGVITQYSASATHVDAGLLNRALLWKNLNLLRLLTMYGAAVILLLAVNRNISVPRTAS